MEIKKHFCSFSEAIREGAKLRPQGTGRLFERNRSCAIGAGIEALGFKDKADGMIVGAMFFSPLYPYLDTTDAACPVCSTVHRLTNQLVHLNDAHYWTRESIADWLESEEEKLGYVTLTEKEETNVQKKDDTFSASLSACRQP